MSRASSTVYPRMTRPLAVLVAILASHAALVIVVHLLRPKRRSPFQPDQPVRGRPVWALITSCVFAWGIASWLLAAGLRLDLAGPARPAIGLGLLIAAGAGLVVAGFVRIDVPYDIKHLSRTGVVHVGAASLSYLSLPLSALVPEIGFESDLRCRPLAHYLPALALVILTFMPLVFGSEIFLPAVFGSLRKIFALLILIWILGARILGSHPGPVGRRTMQPALAGGRAGGFRQASAR